MPQLVEAFHGEPWRILWRFDPILCEHSSIHDFSRIADAMASHSIRSCTFSTPAYRSLKGDLTPYFQKAGIPKWPQRRQKDFVLQMVRIATDLNITLKCCSQPEHLAIHPAIEPAQCIPDGLIRRGYLAEITASLCRDRSQRTHCKCVESEDLGDYETDRCGGGCVYCYSKAGGPLPTAKANRSEDRTGSLLLPGLRDPDPEGSNSP